MQQRNLNGVRERGSAAAEAIFYLATLALAAESVRRMAASAPAPDWSHFSLLLLLACVATRLRLRLPGLDRPVSLAFPFCFAAITELPGIFALGLIAAVQLFDYALESGPRSEVRRELLLDGLYRLAVTAVSVFSAGWVYRGLSVGDGLAWAVGSVAAAALYFVVMSALRSVRTAIHEGSNPFTVWNQTYFWTSPIYLLAPFGVLVSKLLLEAESFLDTAVGLSVIAAAYWYLHIYFPRLYEEQDHAQKLAEIRQRALETLVVAIEAKDGSTAGHLERVKRLALRLGAALGCTAEQLRTLRLAAVLHDVGKVGVPDYILQKPSRLTEDEFKEIAAHAGIGANIVSTMDFPEPVDEIVLSHHEHWDGSGYPRGLQGEEIPHLARILTVVDCFDALVSERPYRGAMPIDGAVDLMERQRAKIFDPAILDAFVGLVPSFADDLRRELTDEIRLSNEPPPPLVDVKQTWVEKDVFEPTTTSQTLQRLGRRPQHLETLHQIMSALGADLDYDQSFERTLESLAEVSGASVAALFVLQPQSSELTVVASRGLPAEARLRLSLSAHSEVVENALQSEQPILSDGSLAESGLQPVGSNLAASLRIEDKPIGLLLLSSTHPNTFDQEHAVLVGLLSDKLASTVIASQQLRKLHTDANTDPVTGLPNARASFQRLEQEINRAGRQQQPLGVLFSDLTGLKPVNDSYGHIAGDRLLAATAGMLRDSLRSYDFVGRVGGDEFLALLPGISLENLDRTVAQIKLNLRESPVELVDGEFVRAVLSIGAALYPDDGVTAKDLLELSDQRMYEDKQRDLSAGLTTSAKPPNRAKAQAAAQTG